MIGNVALASSADTIATIWARQEKVLSYWLLLLLILSPAVFISFGQIAHKTGLSIASATANTLLVLSTILVGLVFFGEWRSISLMQYVGMTLSILGIVLMLFFPKN